MYVYVCVCHTKNESIHFFPASFTPTQLFGVQNIKT